MSEYKRFVAYFYEYIDGKKQKNAGFAKVELRDGLWRVLFRLASAAESMAPVQVYGFVRENGYLRGILLGMLNGTDNRNENGNEYGKEGRLMENPPQEWAWSAREPVGTGKYTFDQLNGIYVQSGDGRIFATVWDDEAVDPGRFVPELPGAEMISENHAENESRPTAHPQEVPSEEPPQPPEEFPHPPEAPSEEPPQPPEEFPHPPEEPAEKPAERPQEFPEPSELPPEESSILPVKTSPLHTWELPDFSSGETTQPGAPQIPFAQSAVIDRSDERMSALHEQAVPAMSHSVRTEEIGVEMQSEKMHGQPNQTEMLLHSRQQFQPFQDEELIDCVQIRLCDLTLLQQSGWPVGRNNFLQHGYYQYRHLLFGRNAEGDYVLGVPSVYSPREEYMAGVFGYNQFKLSSQYSCGRKFGYWYRVLKKEEGERR
ncbi:MAG: hypothetical protein LUI87_00120 [Lachnospiraceae bacterium]|nr:hypothetical protein [Lachnospiraceae bacterium]